MKKIGLAAVFTVLASLLAAEAMAQTYCQRLRAREVADKAGGIEYSDQEKNMNKVLAMLAVVVAAYSYTASPAKAESYTECASRIAKNWTPRDGTLMDKYNYTQRWCNGSEKGNYRPRKVNSSSSTSFN